MISEEGLQKFKGIYKKRYGIELESKELFTKANNLLNLYRVVYGADLIINMKCKDEKKVQHKKNKK